MGKVERTVEELVNQIERGGLKLPEMQRSYVWRSTRVRDLLDSLYRGYPSGAILVWETDEAVPLQAMAVSQQAQAGQSIQLLLDGQQRLTSLSAVLRGEPVHVRGRTRPMELLFNLDHPDALSVVTEMDDDGSPDDDDDADGGDDDETEDDLLKRFSQMAFVVSTKKLEQLPNWVKVTDVFKNDNNLPFLKRAGVTALDDPRAEKYGQRLARLRGVRKYAYRLDVLERNLSYEEVTEIFVRVNSLGAKLRSSDLALAQITAKWRGSLAEFQAFKEECAKAGYDLELGIHLKNLVAFATGQSRFLTVAGLSLERLQTAWNECRPGMEFAINFLKSNCGVDSPALLSSPFLVVALAAIGHKRGYQLTPDEGRQLRQWALLANAKARYSRGSSETFLDQDLATLRQGGSISDLVDRLRTQVGRLDIVPEELEGRNARSSLFKTMFLAFRAGGAKDWHSHLAIAISHKGTSHKLEFHHVFPKAFLTKQYTAREADDIANLAFIGGKTNRTISAKPPGEYLPAIAERAGHDSLAAQCVPLEPALLTLDSYKAFLVERRKAIAARLNTDFRRADQRHGRIRRAASGGLSEVELEAGT